jgi:hypothetical protein
MVVGWTLYGVVCAGLAWSTSAAAAVGWFMVSGVVAATTEGPERAFIAGASPGGKRGTGFGIYHAAVGMAALPGSLAIGALYAIKGGSSAFLVSGAVGLALAVAGSMVSEPGAGKLDGVGG